MWGLDPLVLFLAERQSPTRFSFTYPLTGREDHPFHSEWNEEFLRDIRDRPSAVIVLGESDTNPLQPRSSVQQVERWPAIHTFVSEHYVLDSTVAGYRLYRLQEQ